MKRTIMFLFSAQAADVATGSNVATEPTSEKLTALKAQYLEEGAKIASFEVGSKDWNDQMLVVYKTKSLIDAEISAIKKAENDAKVQAAKLARMAIVSDFRAAVIADYVLQNDKKSTADEKSASAEALTKQQESLTNEVLGSLKHTPAKATGTGDKPAGEGKGATSARIRAAFIANRAAGMTDSDNIKAIIEGGESRGTTGAVVLAYQREIGEKA